MDFLYLQSSSLWCLTLTDTTGGKAERPGAGGGLGHVTAFATRFRSPRLDLFEIVPVCFQRDCSPEKRYSAQIVKDLFFTCLCSFWSKS